MLLFIIKMYDESVSYDRVYWIHVSSIPTFHVAHATLLRTLRYVRGELREDLYLCAWSLDSDHTHCFLNLLLSNVLQ